MSKGMKFTTDDSNKGFVCSSSKSSTISIWKLNQSVYELHKPEGKPSMQILFFHGLQFENYNDAHLTTWESRDGSHLWPQTWLVEAFPGAHVLSVSYDARVEKGEGNMDLHIIGENLSSDVVEANIGQETRCPVILVGHCFGGLVIKQLCLHARKTVDLKGESDPNETASKLRKFLLNVKGIFYYATPHYGIPLNVARWFMHEGPLLQFVKRLSKHSARLNSDFDDLRHRHYKDAWRVAGVGESLPTKWGRFKDVVVVPEASARQGEDFNVVEAADHISICKPESKTSRSFYALTNLISKSIAVDLKVNSILPVHECHGLPDYPVDLERQCWEVREKLKDKQVLGIVGMGGIGKTTLAKQLFNNISQEFEYTCFVDNAKAIKIHKLGDRLLRQFHRYGSKVDQTDWPHLRGMKTLIVIDDVDSEDQLLVLPKLHHFGSGSRVIITSRNQSVLKVFDSYICHQVEFLKEANAKTLFCKNAFQEGEIPSFFTRREELVTYVEVVVQKCDGLPLTLEVIGRHLRAHDDHEIDTDLWKEAIFRLGNAQPIDGVRDDRVWAKLQVSVDALSGQEKEMFVSAATFFFNWPLERVLAAWSTTCGTSRIGWMNLVSKSLVKEIWKTIHNANEQEEIKYKAVWVHEHLRDLAKIRAPGNAISTSNEKDPQNLLGLFIANPVVDANTVFLELSADGSFEKEMAFRFESILNLKQLKYLELKRILIEGSPKKFPRNISLLHWESASIKNECLELPISCIEEMENLAVLELKHWTFSQVFLEALCKLINLRILSLVGMDLVDHLPEDFGRLSKLKRLELNLGNLSKLPESFGRLSSLEYFQFEGYELTELPLSFANLSSLVTVKILRCPKLVALPVNFGLLRALENCVLGDHFTNMCMWECLPDSFGQLKALRNLTINLQKLQSLPSSFCCLSSLQELRIFAQHLETLPENLGQLTSLHTLHLYVQSVKVLPESVGQLSSLRDLAISSDSLKAFPESVGQLSSLRQLKIISDVAESLPESLGQLASLHRLDLNIDSMEAFPESIGKLSSLRELAINSDVAESLPESLGQLASLHRLDLNIDSMEAFPESIGKLSSLRELTITSDAAESLPENLGQLASLYKLNLNFDSMKALPESVGRLSSLRELTLRSDVVETLPESLGQLTSLHILNLNVPSLKVLPESVGQLSSLRELFFISNVVEMLPDVLGQLNCLQSLSIHCPKIKNLPDSLGQLNSLQCLTIKCPGIKNLPDSLGQLSSLRRLHIYCPGIKNLPNSLGRLSSLQLFDLQTRNLASFPKSLGTLFSLRELTIRGKFEILPEELGHLTSLQYLTLSDCTKLKGLPDSLGRSFPRQGTVIDAPENTSSNRLRVCLCGCPLLNESILNSLGWVLRSGYYVRGSI